MIVKTAVLFRAIVILPVLSIMPRLLEIPLVLSAGGFLGRGILILRVGEIIWLTRSVSGKDADKDKW
jgi:hypothetical protein